MYKNSPIMYKIWMRIYSDFCNQSAHILQFLRHNYAYIVIFALQLLSINQFLELTCKSSQHLHQCIIVKMYTKGPLKYFVHLSPGQMGKLMNVPNVVEQALYFLERQLGVACKVVQNMFLLQVLGRLSSVPKHLFFYKFYKQPLTPNPSFYKVMLQIFIGPRSPGPIYVSGLSVTE